MKQPTEIRFHQGRLLHSCQLIAAAVLLTGFPALAGAAPSVSLYDNDAQHLWNRLSAALITRAPAGQTVPPDLLDPPDFELLLDGSTNQQAVALLAEFIKGPPAPGAMTPLQRAVLQRDLLAVFHQLAVRGQDLRGPNWSGPERELTVALALAIRHVALPAEEIRKLPDNYAAATAAPNALTADDPGHPAAFLPVDLLTDNGAWIALEAYKSGRGLVPQFHFEFFQGRSSFEVRMRHPQGRIAGEAYLKSLTAMTQPMLFDNTDKKGERQKPNGPDGAPRPNPATPQFPIGTMWALVRRAMLADEKGQPVVSPLVESIQIRVYRHVSRGDALKSPELSKQVKELEDAKSEYDYDDLLAACYQTSFEWEMKRSLLLGKGGFHLTQPEDLKYARLQSVHARPIAGFCMQCHGTDGIHSVQSRAGLFSDPLAWLPELKPSDRTSLDRITTGKARSQPGWLLLQWLWQDPPVR